MEEGKGTAPNAQNWRSLSKFGSPLSRLMDWVSYRTTDSSHFPYGLVWIPAYMPPTISPDNVLWEQEVAISGSLLPFSSFTYVPLTLLQESPKNLFDMRILRFLQSINKIFRVRPIHLYLIFVNLFLCNSEVY